MTDKLQVGLIGIGMMGKPMARRILRGGFPLIVFDIRPEPVEELKKEGARTAQTPEEVSRVSDVVLTSLPSLAACQEVYFGRSGILKSVRAGQVLVETSTVPPANVLRIAEAVKDKGVSVVDAPLLAARTGLLAPADAVVELGQATVMAGGDAEAVEKVRPVLATYGDPVLHMGKLGAGERSKVIINAITHVNFCVAAEGLTVGAKGGVDLGKLYEIVTRTGVTSTFERYVKPFLESGTGHVMRTEGVVKDSQSMLDLARELGVPVLIMSLGHAYFEWAENSGLKDQPWIEMLKLWEGVVGKPIRF